LIPGAHGIHSTPPPNFAQFTQLADRSFSGLFFGRSANSTFKPKVFIGMPSSPSSCSSGYLEYGQATKVIEANMDKDSFGGVMFWDAGGSTANLMNGVEYGTAISKFLKVIFHFLAFVAGFLFTRFEFAWKCRRSQGISHLMFFSFLCTIENRRKRRDLSWREPVDSTAPSCSPEPATTPQLPDVSRLLSLSDLFCRVFLCVCPVPSPVLSGLILP
jgi:hypothetical protein